MQSVCCVCFKSIPVDERINIFNENSWIFVHSKNYEKEKIRLSDSIELITGLKIIEKNRQLVNLCLRCFQNVQSSINLRTQLLISLCSSNNTSVLNANVKSTNIVQNKKSICSLENANTIDNKLIKDETMLEYAVNDTDETNIPLYNIIDDSITESEQEDNTSNSMENSSILYRMIDFKNQDNIESEIDVCSGEDEEVLELDLEIDTSESDIEVCDYQPCRKRLKICHDGYSPALSFYD